MGEVKRYHHKSIPGVTIEYVAVPNGIFVNWSDYEALAAERAAAALETTGGSHG